jgi:uncharacterized protein with GYD domain
MAKFLIQAAYTIDGAKGVLKEGGSPRKAQIAQILERVGGKLESFYYAFGEWDVIAIMDAPDSVTATALSMAINASGGVKLRTTPLITPEEIDQATKKSIAYRAPGA